MDPLDWRGSCLRCQNKLVKGVRKFCGNFCTGQGTYLPCQMMWYIGCYDKQQNDVFPKRENGNRRRLGRGAVNPLQ